MNRMYIVLNKCDINVTYLHENVTLNITMLHVGEKDYEYEITSNALYPGYCIPATIDCLRQKTSFFPTHGMCVIQECLHVIDAETFTHHCNLQKFWQPRVFRRK